MCISHCCSMLDHSTGAACYLQHMCNIAGCGKCAGHLWPCGVDVCRFTQPLPTLPSDAYGDHGAVGALELDAVRHGLMCKASLSAVPQVLCL